MLYSVWGAADWKFLDLRGDAGCIPNLDVLSNKGAATSLRNVPVPRSRGAWAGHPAKRPPLVVGGGHRSISHAIGLLFHYPQAHFQLGLALKQLGDRARALRSFELAVHQAPRFLEAHRELAELYEQSNNLTLWLKHDRLAKGMPLE